MARLRAAWLAAELAEEAAWRRLDPDVCADAYVRSVEEQTDVEPSAFELLFRLDGASDAGRAAAVAAAKEVFRAAGVTPAAGARGWWERDGWDRTGFAADASPREANIRAAMVWDRADQAAVDACGACQADKSPGGCLELVWRQVRQD